MSVKKKLNQISYSPPPSPLHICPCGKTGISENRSYLFSSVSLVNSGTSKRLVEDPPRPAGLYGSDRRKYNK